MAERSFAREVEDLKLGDGEIFRGEGILAITKALLQSGVSYVGGYQGSPISHLMDVLADAKDVLDDLGVHFETSASEATAAATLSASVMYPMRGAVTWKSTAGTNVAADALSNLSSGGVTGGAMIIIGEDYGEGSSIMQERSHAFALKSQIWLLDPRPNLPTLVRMVEEGFELSEASNTPVMLEVRIRTCHVHGQFRLQGQPEAEIHACARRSKIRCATSTASCCRRLRSCTKRRSSSAACRPRSNSSSRASSTRPSAPRRATSASSCSAACTTRRCARCNISASPTRYGELRRAALRAQRRLSADRGRTHRRSAADKKAVLVVEEGAPDYIERDLNTILRRRDIQTKVSGKDVLPMGGEYTAPVLTNGLARISRDLRSRAARQRAAAARSCSDARRSPREGARRSRAAAAAGLLHRLSRAADLRGDEARRAGTRPASRLRRHRLPSVLDPAAVQYRRDDDGLRTGARFGLGLQRASWQALDLSARRRRLLAQRADLVDRQCGVQQA